MASNDPIAAILDQLAAHREQLARLSRTLDEHTAALGPCWPAHDLCLYALDIASGLWSVLYLQPGRDQMLLSAQAEYQARILPALAAQLMTETTRCRHTRPRSTP